MQIKNPFSGWQHAIAGSVIGLCAGDDDTVTVPTERLTVVGVCIMIPAVSIFSIVNGILFILFLVITWGTDESFLGIEPDDMLTIFSRSFLDNVEKMLTEKHTPNFKDEYLFYKYWRKFNSFMDKKGWNKGIPEGLEDKAANAYHNYLVAELSGLGGES